MPTGCGWFRGRKSKASGCLGVTTGPGVGEEIAHVIAGGTGGEPIEICLEDTTEPGSPRARRERRRAGEGQ